MHDRDLGIQIGPQTIDQRHRKRYLRHQDEGRPAGRDRFGDGLGVDRRFARTRDALQEQRRGVAIRDGGEDRGQRLRLRRGQKRTFGASATPAGPTPCQRPARSFPHVRRHQPAPRQARGGPGAVALGHLSRRQPERARRFCRRKLLEQGPLARPQPRDLGPGGHSSALRCERQPALESRPDRGSQRPLQAHDAARCHGPQPPQRGRPTVDTLQVAGRARPVGQSLDDGSLFAIDRRAAERLSRRSSRVRWRPLGHQLQPLEHAGRQHRAQSRGRRSQVLLGYPAGKVECQAWQQRAVGAHPRQDRLGVDGQRPAGRSEHHAEGLAAAPELDQDGLAILQIAEPVRHRVGVCPGGPGGVYGNFARRLARCRSVGARCRSIGAHLRPVRHGFLLRGAGFPAKGRIASFCHRSCPCVGSPLRR